MTEAAFDRIIIGRDKLLSLVKEAINADDYGPEDWERWNNKAIELVREIEGTKEVK